ncbi:hypothetical protein P168DRAFT_328992 [Aspergillus campestris IBT 28561]|uniref:Uncharacterized protein n=1 Tax=Aspergillus campestris (strain IBT 28561) TaxID=1392248 RepID=A0A2I1CWK3_ASPC2|nr:uncharacterized protein P168DRAFT_328992 [Aspergillus campestris IBT 28561]PKY02004.1 hypothetical protein P168DRAFT_328992 [Aspergillus campestris IBT 28561]
MVSRTKIQRRRNSKGGRWTPELLKELYDSRNTDSHLSWKEFHQKNLFPGRSNWALQKAYSTYRQELRLERRAKRMHPAASTPKPSLYTPNTRVLKRPSQAEKDPRLRNRKQAKLYTSPKYNNSAPPGTIAGVQNPSPDPSSDTDSDDGDIPPSGRTEKFPKSAQQAKANGSHHASPSTSSTAPSPRVAPATAEISESRPEQQSRSGSQPTHKITTLHYANKEPKASAPDSPASAQSKRSTPQAQQPGREETMSAQSLDMDLVKLVETANSLARRTKKSETERQGLEAINSTLQTMYSSLQTKNSTLQKDFDASQELHNQLTSCQEIKIEQLKTENQQLCDEVARLRDESCRECLKMRAMLVTKDEELAKKDEELLTLKGEWNSKLEIAVRDLMFST